MPEGVHDEQAFWAVAVHIWQYWWQAVQIFGEVDENVERGHDERQVFPSKYAVSGPDKVQTEQSVEEEEHIWHFWSHSEQTVPFSSQ